MGQHFKADAILLADLPPDRPRLTWKAPAPQWGASVAVGSQRAIGKSPISLGLSPIASSKNTVVFCGEFSVIAAKIGPQIGSNAYRE